MRFQSKYPRYKVIIKPSYYRYDNLGNQRLVVGKRAQFENGIYETVDEEEIEALKNNKYYGVDFWSLDDEKVTLTPQAEMTKRVMERTKQELVTDCPYCSKTFRNKAGLMAHIRLVHKKEK